MENSLYISKDSDPIFIVVPTGYMDDYTRGCLDEVMEILLQEHRPEEDGELEVIPRFKTEEEAEIEMYIRYISKGLDQEAASRRAMKAAGIIREINEAEKRQNKNPE